MNIVTAFNRIRSQSEGNLQQAHKLATEAGLPPKVVEYIALTTVWRQFANAFRLLCANIADDENLPVFWRGAVLESLGATNPAGQETARLAYFDRAIALVQPLETSNDARLYVETCVAAGRAETPGQMPLTLEQRADLANTMLDKGWFNAPGRIEGIIKIALDPRSGAADPAKLANITPYALPLIGRYRSLKQGENNFAPSQCQRLENLIAQHFPSA